MRKIYSAIPNSPFLVEDTRIYKVFLNGEQVEYPVTACSGCDGWVYFVDTAEDGRFKRTLSKELIYRFKIGHVEVYKKIND